MSVYELRTQCRGDPSVLVILGFINPWTAIEEEGDGEFNLAEPHRHDPLSGITKYGEFVVREA
jgi:hypothetical protein